MANTYKSIYRVNPSAATLTSSSALGAATILSTITVCNRSATATSFRIAVSPTGAAVADEDYLYYDVPISGNDTFQSTSGIAIQSGGIIRVYATLATLSFNFNGVEVT